VFDVVLSDMAPKTTGIRDADQAHSIGLVEEALALALELLGPDGVFVAKVFQGRGIDELLRTVQRAFFESKVLKPEATREGSREVFIIAKRPRPHETPEE
jgi:23S rRNA (uridine2552-2'-O)-methyltransferase